MKKFIIELSDVYGKLILLEEKLNAKHSYKLKEFIYDIIQKGAPNIVIDLKKVKYIDSSVISAFMLAKRLLEQKGTGNVYLINVNEPVLKILKLVYIDKQIPILASEEKARELIFLETLKQDIDETEQIKPKPEDKNEHPEDSISELMENWHEEDLLIAEFDEAIDQIEDLINFLQEHLEEVESQYKEDDNILEEIFKIDDEIIE